MTAAELRLSFITAESAWTVKFPQSDVTFSENGVWLPDFRCFRRTSFMSNPRYRPYFWMLAGCFASALMSQLAHLLKDDCDWRLVALARSSLAFLFALVLARLFGAKLVLWKPGALWLRSISSSASLLCMFFALSRLRTSEVLTLTNTFPIWVAFLSWPMLHVRPTGSVWLAAVCGVLGVAMIQSPHFDADSAATPAILMSLIAALTSAVAMIGLHRVKGVHPWAIVAHYSGVATVIVLASWCVGGVPSLAPLQNGFTLLLLLGVGVAALVGQLCFTHAFTTGDPARLAVVGLMQIIFALGLDLLIYGPTIHGLTLAGMALVLAPTAWMMAGKATKPARPAETEESLHSQPENTEKSGNLPDLRKIGRSVPDREASSRTP
jgi:drug/metabolite transporter (DMT)-like permease